MVRALRIPVDSDEPISEIQVDSLEDYQEIVGGCELTAETDVTEPAV